MSAVAALPLVPPAPTPPPKPLGTWQAIRTLRRNTLQMWPQHSYEQMITRRVMAGGQCAYLVNDPAAIRQVLQTRATDYIKTTISLRLLRPIVGQGVLLSEGEPWRRQRRMLAPAFTPAHVGLLLPHFAAAAQGLEALIDRRGRVNMVHALQETALDAACRSLFSMPIGGRGATLAALARRYSDGPGRPTMLDTFAREEHDFSWFTPSRPRWRRQWMAQVDAVIAARRATGQDGPRDLLDLLMEARDAETGAPLDDAEIRDQSSTLLAAGFETTARGLFWTAYLLALDGAEQARIREEIAAAPPGDADDLAYLGRWPRLRNAIHEALRLYPPVPVIPRRALAHDTVLGEAIRPGDVVFVSPWVLHRHKRLWDRPEAFIPDRFEGQAQAYLTDGRYLPFGAGPRICIGATFAMSEMMLIMARLIARYAIAVDDPRPVQARATISTAPDIEPWFRLTPI